MTKLATELNYLREMGMPTVWFTPPTINTRALNSDEKRMQMNEDSLEDMRRMYAELGVESSVSFVLDGPSFTHGRVTDSFDGVHYPPDVYDAGAQILFNALDWLMVNEITIPEGFYTPMPGSFSNTYLGLMMLCFALIGLFFFDGYFGFSYLAQFFVRNHSVLPNELYDDAFAPILKHLTLNQNRGALGPLYDTSANREMFGHIGHSTGSLSKRR